MNIRPSRLDDTQQIAELYKRVASIPGGIARLEHEVNEAYVRDFLARSVANGVARVATNDSGTIVAEIHAYSAGLYCFGHVLSELTVVVDPDRQGQGTGRKIFDAFLNAVRNDHPHITRVELIARESNVHAISFYESLGFAREGKLRGRICNVDGSIEADIPMAWIRPGKRSGGCPSERLSR